MYRGGVEEAVRKSRDFWRGMYLKSCAEEDFNLVFGGVCGVLVTLLATGYWGGWHSFVVVGCLWVLNIHHASRLHPSNIKETDHVA